MIATLLITGVATFAVGLVPLPCRTTGIGIWGARVADGHPPDPGHRRGRRGGAVRFLLAMEWAQTTKHRGFIASWPQFGAPAGLFLANTAVLFFSWLSGDQFLTWGWRIPFYLSAVMVAVGLWIRLGIMETPVFRKILEEERTERVPVLEVLKRQPKQVLPDGVAADAGAGTGHIVGAFIFTYGTGVLGQSRDFLLWGVIAQTVLGFAWVTCAGYLSDVVGRKKHVQDARLRDHGDIRLRVFRVARYDESDDHLHRDRDLSDPRHDAVRVPEAALIAEIVLAPIAL